MDRIFRTGDRRTDFIIKNYSKVLDLQECREHAESHLPDALQKRVRALLETWGYRQPKIDKQSLRWADEGYYDSSTGIRYCIESFSWGSLIWNGEGGYPVYLCVYYD